MIELIDQSIDLWSKQSKSQPFEQRPIQKLAWQEIRALESVSFNQSNYEMIKQSTSLQPTYNSVNQIN